MVGMYPQIQIQVDTAIKRVLESGRFIFGPEIEKFEAKFAKYLEVKHVIGVGSGTDALMIALWALERGPGEVIVPSLTAMPTATAVCLAGHKPVFVDVDEMYTLDPNQVKRAINKNTVAIIPVHLYGHPAELMAIRDAAGDVPVIEDCAQAHGALLGKGMVGGFGGSAAFSFYPTKNLGAYGDAGAIATNSDELMVRCRELRQYGWGWKSGIQTFNHHGTNSRMSEVQAAILSVKLPYLDVWNEVRRKQAGVYNQAFKHLPLVLPAQKPGYQHVYHQYVIRSEHRDDLQKVLGRSGIETQVHYPAPVHQQPYYQRFKALEMPNTELWCKQILSLPIGPHVPIEIIMRVIEIVRRYF